MKPKKHLGQHFLIRQEVAESITALAEIKPSEVVVEIGAGTGILTRALAKRAKKVITFEVDSDLIPTLKENLLPYPNVEIVPEDFLKKGTEVLNSLEEFKVVANLPYYITTPIIFLLLGFLPRLKLAVLTVQKEVAERLAAKPGNKTYGALTISAGIFAEVKKVKVIKKGAFRPAPRVDSAVVRLKPHTTLPLQPQEINPFLNLVHSLFTQRRKTILNGITRIYKIPKPKAKALLENCGLEPNRRPEDLNQEEFIRLTKEVIACVKDRIFPRNRRKNPIPPQSGATDYTSPAVRNGKGNRS